MAPPTWGKRHKQLDLLDYLGLVTEPYLLNEAPYQARNKIGPGSAGGISPWAVAVPVPNPEIKGSPGYFDTRFEDNWDPAT